MARPWPSSNPAAFAMRACSGTSMPPMMVAMPFLARSFQLLQWLPAEKSPAVLEDRGREFLRGAGLAAAPVDDAWGLTLDYGFVRHLKETDRSVRRWEALSKGSRR